MIEVTGDIFEYAEKNKEVSAICCTTNRVVKNDGQLVMGAGVAKAFAEKFPWLPLEWGSCVSNYGIGGRHTYSSVRNWYPKRLEKFAEGITLVAFTTKIYWQEPSTLAIIRRSLNSLVSLGGDTDLTKCVLPRPGCCNGGLSWEKDGVRDLCGQFLDDRFIIISKE